MVNVRNSASLHPDLSNKNRVVINNLLTYLLTYLSDDNADDFEIYRRPVTSSREIGVWNRDEPLREKEPWTYVRRRVHLDSEMTR